MSLILKNKATLETYDVISLKEISPAKLPVIVKEFERDYIVKIKREKED